MKTIANLLLDKQEMLDEYFSVKLSQKGEVETLPMLLKGYSPNLDRLPHFLLCLGTQVRPSPFSPLIVADKKVGGLGGRTEMLRNIPPRTRLLLLSSPFLFG